MALGADGKPALDVRTSTLEMRIVEGDEDKVLRRTMQAASAHALQAQAASAAKVVSSHGLDGAVTYMHSPCQPCQSLGGAPDRPPLRRRKPKLKRRTTQPGTRRPSLVMRRGWSSLTAAPTLEALQRWWSSGALLVQVMTRTWRQTRSA